MADRIIIIDDHETWPRPVAHNIPRKDAMRASDALLKEGVACFVKRQNGIHSGHAHSCTDCLAEVAELVHGGMFSV